MKRVFQGVMFLALSILAVSCSSDDDGISTNSIVVESTNFDISESRSGDISIFGETAIDSVYQLGFRIYGVDNNDTAFFDLYSSVEGDIAEGDYVYGGVVSSDTDTTFNQFSAGEYSSASTFVINGLSYFPTEGTFRVREIATGLYSVAFDGQDANGVDLEFDFDGTVIYTDFSRVPGEIDGVAAVGTNEKDLLLGFALDFSDNANPGIFNYDLKIFAENRVDFVYIEGFSRSAGFLEEGVYTYDPADQVFNFGDFSNFFIDGVTTALTSGSFTVIESTSDHYYEITFEGLAADGITPLTFNFEGTLLAQDGFNGPAGDESGEDNEPLSFTFSKSAAKKSKN